MKNWLYGCLVVAVMAAFLMPSVANADAATAKKYLVYANGLYKQRQYDKAIQYYSGALKQDRRLAAAWKGLGNSYYAKRDKANAIKYYKFALQLNPNDKALANFVSKLASGGGGGNPLARANALYKQRNYPGAIAAYNQVIASNPNDAKAYQGLGNAYYAKGDKPSAVKAYRRALRLNPGNQALANFLARYAPESSETQVADGGGSKDWVQPLWRSALLPGWGQFYNGQKVKGTILGVSTLGLWGAEIATYMIGSGAAKDYRALDASATQAEFDSKYKTWETMAKINHISFIGHTVLFTFTLIDAVWSAKRKPTNQAMFVPQGQENEPRLKMAASDYGTKLEYDLIRF